MAPQAASSQAGGGAVHRGTPPRPPADDGLKPLLIERRSRRGRVLRGRPPRRRTVRGRRGVAVPVLIGRDRTTGKRGVVGTRAVSARSRGPGAGVGRRKEFRAIHRRREMSFRRIRHASEARRPAIFAPSTHPIEALVVPAAVGHIRRIYPVTPAVVGDGDGEGGVLSGARTGFDTGRLGKGVVSGRPCRSRRQKGVSPYLAPCISLRHRLRVQRESGARARASLGRGRAPRRERAFDRRRGSVAKLLSTRTQKLDEKLRTKKYPESGILRSTILGREKLLPAEPLVGRISFRLKRLTCLSYENTWFVTQRLIPNDFGMSNKNAGMRSDMSEEFVLFGANKKKQPSRQICLGRGRSLRPLLRALDRCRDIAHVFLPGTSPPRFPPRAGGPTTARRRPPTHPPDAFRRRRRVFFFPATWSASVPNRLHLSRTARPRRARRVRRRVRVARAPRDACSSPTPV